MKFAGSWGSRRSFTHCTLKRTLGDVWHLNALTLTFSNLRTWWSKRYKKECFLISRECSRDKGPLFKFETPKFILQTAEWGNINRLIVSNFSISRAASQRKWRTWIPHPPFSSLVYLRMPALDLKYQTHCQVTQIVHTVQTLRFKMAASWEQDPHFYINKNCSMGRKSECRLFYSDFILLLMYLCGIF